MASSWARSRTQLALVALSLLQLINSMAVMGFGDVDVYCLRFRPDHLHVTDPGTFIRCEEPLFCHHGIYLGLGLDGIFLQLIYT